jgi:cephalosporin hydroxylase
VYTRQEFESLRIENAKKMAGDKQLRKEALDIKVKAGHDYYWVHQTNWMGEPCLQLPQDMFALQEALFKSKPDYVIECGVAWAGTSLFYATLLSVLGGKKVIGVDIYIPEDLRQRVKDKMPKEDSIELIEKSSVEQETYDMVRNKIEDSAQSMVILDSNHTHDHVLAELRLYSQLIKPGGYIICGDTIIDEQPTAEKRPRAWGEGNNPATALRQFMSETDNFEVDTEIENKLLLSNMPSGYLRKK